MIGTLGDVVFESSTDRVRTYNSLSRSGSTRYQEHEIAGRKPLIEFIGPGLEEVSFTMRLDVALGINPLREIERLRHYRDNGNILTLVIAGKFQGDWVLESLSEEWKNQDRQGRLLVAIAQCKLKEVAQ
jgi:phage protein U